LREKNEISHFCPPPGNNILTTFKNAHYSGPPSKNFSGAEPVARIKSLGANTYFGGEEKLWAITLGSLLPNSPRG